MPGTSITDDPTVTSVAASTSAVTLFSTSGDVSTRQVHNDSTAVLYIKYGTAAATTDFTVKVPADGYFEFPYPVYRGATTGIWSAANGSARCTEVS